MVEYTNWRAQEYCYYFLNWELNAGLYFIPYSKSIRMGIGVIDVDGETAMNEVNSSNRPL